MTDKAAESAGDKPGAPTPEQQKRAVGAALLFLAFWIGILSLKVGIVNAQQEF